MWVFVECMQRNRVLDVEIDNLRASLPAQEGNVLLQICVFPFLPVGKWVVLAVPHSISALLIGASCWWVLATWSLLCLPLAIAAQPVPLIRCLCFMVAAVHNAAKITSTVVETLGKCSCYQTLSWFKRSGLGREEHLLSFLVFFQTI